MNNIPGLRLLAAHRARRACSLLTALAALALSLVHSMQGTAEYLQFKSREAMSRLVGATEVEVARAVDVLGQLGATDVQVSPLKDFGAYNCRGF